MGNTFQNQILGIVAIIMFALNIVVVFYALFLGWKMGTATDEGKRKEAKNRMINTIVSFFLIFIFIFMLWTVDFLGRNDQTAGNNISLGLPSLILTVGPPTQNINIIYDDGVVSAGTFTATSQHTHIIQVLPPLLGQGGGHFRLQALARGDSVITVREQIPDQPLMGRVWTFNFTVE